MRAKVKVAFGDRENGDRLYLPGDAFDGSAGRIAELEEGGFVARARTGGRPTREELLAEADAEMTNPELHEAVQKAKASPARTRKKRP